MFTHVIIYFNVDQIYFLLNQYQLSLIAITITPKKVEKS